MNLKKINIFGYYNTGESQFLVKSQKFDVKINEQRSESVEPNPLEYLLAGFAGYINAVAQLVAQELGIILKGLQVEISGEIETFGSHENIVPKISGFQKIDVVVKPASDATFSQLQKWLKLVEERYPVQNNLVNNNVVVLTLVNPHSQPELELIETA